MSCMGMCVAFVASTHLIQAAGLFDEVDIFLLQETLFPPNGHFLFEELPAVPIPSKIGSVTPLFHFGS